MATTSAVEESTDSTVRQKYVLMGIDSHGSHHLYKTDTESVHVVHPNNGREHVADISGHERDTDWMAFVGQQRGWDRQFYFTDATDGSWF